jgi:hypothetical protein
MEYGHSWEADRHFAIEEIPSLFWSPNVHDSLDKSPHFFPWRSVSLLASNRDSRDIFTVLTFSPNKWTSTLSKIFVPMIGSLMENSYVRNWIQLCSEKRGGVQQNKVCSLCSCNNNIKKTPIMHIHLKDNNTKDRLITSRHSLMEKKNNCFT